MQHSNAEVFNGPGRGWYGTGGCEFVTKGVPRTHIWRAPILTFLTEATECDPRRTHGLVSSSFFRGRDGEDLPRRHKGHEDGEFATENTEVTEKNIKLTMNEEHDGLIGALLRLSDLGALPSA